MSARQRIQLRDKSVSKTLFRVNPRAHRGAALGKLGEKFQMLLQTGAALVELIRPALKLLPQ